MLFKELLRRKRDIWRKWLESGLESARLFWGDAGATRGAGRSLAARPKAAVSSGESTVCYSAVIYDMRGHSLSAACFPSGEKEVLRARSSQSKDKHRGGGRDKDRNNPRKIV